MPTKQKQIIMLQSAIILLLIIFSFNSHAATDCTAIDDEMARSNCFDNQTGQSNKQLNTKFRSITKIEAPEDRLTYLTRVKPFKFIPYEPVYFMPVAFTNHPNSEPFTTIGEVGNEKFEVKFQISTRAKITDDILNKNIDLWFGYTQKSFWQLYNNASSPFRETNYKPELWFSLKTSQNIFGFTNRYMDLGITHESNGRGLTLSRSWNRAFVRFGLEYEDLSVTIMPWSRIDTDKIDNNPDIEKYVGRAEIRMIYKNEDRILAAVIRNNFNIDQNRGSYELNWVVPMSGNLKGVVQYFNGYGESLMDYDTRMGRLSIGLVIIDWL